MTDRLKLQTKGSLTGALKAQSSKVQGEGCEAAETLG